MLSAALRLAFCMAVVAAVASSSSPEKIRYHVCTPIASTMVFSKRYQIRCREKLMIDGDEIEYFVISSTDPHMVNQAEQIVNFAMTGKSRKLRVMPYVARISKENAVKYGFKDENNAIVRIIKAVEMI